MRLVNVGYGNMVSVPRIIAIVAPDAAPIKRMVQDARDGGRVIDATCGHKTKAVLITYSDHIVLSPLLPETITSRIDERRETEA